MDRRRPTTEHSAAMPPDWGFALGVLLRAGISPVQDSDPADYATGLLVGYSYVESLTRLITGRSPLCSRDVLVRLYSAVDLFSRGELAGVSRLFPLTRFKLTPSQVEDSRCAPF